MTVAPRPTVGSCGVLHPQAGLRPANQPRPAVSVLALQFSESLELSVVLDRVARTVASLFQGICRVQFTPAQRPADARCVVATADSPASSCGAAGASGPYTDLLARLEEHRRARPPAPAPEMTPQAGTAPWGEGNAACEAGAELLLAPLVTRMRRIGQIDVVIPATSGSTLRHDQSLLRELAAHAALAIDTADYLAHQKQTAERASDTTSGRDVGPLLALLAHDLRNPLATVSTSVQMLVREIRSTQGLNVERLAHLVELAEAAVAQLETQVSALTPACDVGSPRGERPAEAIDLVRLTRRMASFYQQTTERHHLSVAADVPELFGRWDPAHIERVLGNVLLNAIKYSAEGGEIQIRVGYDEDGLGLWASLSVWNRGPGIPLQDLPGLSRPGYRARNVGAIPGSGFGLASVREVVEQQGGSFAIQSEVGGSTTVLVRLPL